MSFNTKISQMKNRAGSPDLGSREEVFVYICFMFYTLAISYFLFFKNSFADNFCTRLKLTIICINDKPMISNDKALFLDIPGTY